MSAASQPAQYNNLKRPQDISADMPETLNLLNQTAQIETAVRSQITQSLLQLPTFESRQRVHQAISYLIMADAVCPGVIEQYNRGIDHTTFPVWNERQQQGFTGELRQNSS